MLILLDIGNTRIKWAVSDKGSMTRRGSAVHRGVPAGDWLRPLEAVSEGMTRMLVSNVAGPAVAHALGEWALERFGLRPEFLRATHAAGGIRNSYHHPQGLGADRWLAMIGAWRRVRGTLVCIAAGTAMTVDALDATGQHLGGLIVPGRDMMIDSLLRRTSDIAAAAALATPVQDGMLGHNTAAAIELGAVHALAALAQRSIDWVVQNGDTAPRVFLGGGDAEAIAPLLGVPAEIAPDLVLEGLAVMAEEG